MAPVVVDVVAVVVEVLMASLEVTHAVRLDRSGVRASATPTRVAQVTLKHLLEVRVQFIDVTRRGRVPAEFGEWVSVCLGETLAMKFA